MLNVEDLFANWFDVPIGVLIADAEKPHYITELEEQEEQEEREEREKQESRNDDELRISSTWIEDYASSRLAIIITVYLKYNFL